MIAACVVERPRRYRIRLTAPSTPSHKEGPKVLRLRSLFVWATEIYCEHEEVSLLLAHAIMVNEPANKIETAAFRKHLAIFGLLAHMILHMNKPLSFVFGKSHRQ